MNSTNKPTEKKDLTANSLILLLQKCIAGEFSDQELSHVDEAIKALMENPKSVEIRRSKLKTIWPDSERYLGYLTQGRLVVFMNSPHTRYQKSIKNNLVSFGVTRERIRFVLADAVYSRKNQKELQEIINDRNSRAFLYMKDVSLELKGLIPPETSASLSGPKEENLRHSLEMLRRKLP